MNRYFSSKMDHRSIVMLLLLAMLAVPVPTWAAVEVDTDGFNPEIKGLIGSVSPPLVSDKVR